MVPRHTRRPLAAAFAALAAAGLAVLAIAGTAAGAADRETGSPTAATSTAVPETTASTTSASTTSASTTSSSATASSSTTSSTTSSTSTSTSALPTPTPTGSTTDLDTTAPVIVATVLGDQGVNGWYIGDVLITWSVTDPESKVTDTTGCDKTLIHGGAIARVVTCTATSAGGIDNAQVTINQDTTPPTIVCPVGVQLVQGSAGSLVASVVDEQSGPAEPTVTVPVPTDVLGVVAVSVSASDIAGNVSSSICEVLVILDTSAPVIGDPVITGPLGDNGWFTGDVTVTFDVQESDSTVLSKVGCGPEVVATDNADAVVTCTAVSYGGTSIRTATVARDATGPVIACPTAPSIIQGSTRSLSAAVSDAVSGPAVSSVSGSLPSLVLGPASIALSASDLAGNSSTVDCGYLVIPDTSAPAIAASIQGQVGTSLISGGPIPQASESPWYIGPVSVSFAVTEGESTVLSQSGCGPTVVTTDTTGQVLTCTVTSYGGPFTRSVVVALDTTPPVVTCGPLPVYVQGSGGTVSATFSDATSGPTSLGTTQDVDTTVLGPSSLAITTRDAAGNVGSGDCPYRVIPDDTKPIIIPTIQGTTGTSGWYTGPVTVSFAVSDPNSPVTDIEGCDSITVTADITAQVVAVCRATSFGGTAVQPVTISLDSLTPVITCLPMRFVQGIAGRVTANATDATSGVTSALVAQAADTSTPGNRAIMLTSTDRAGNTASQRCTYEVVEPHTVSATKLSQTGSDSTVMVLGGIAVALAGSLLAIAARARARAHARHRG